MMLIFSVDDFTELIETHFAALLLYARGLGCESPEDAVQNSVLKLIRDMSKYGPPQNPVFWLYKTIRNEATDRFRQLSRQRRHETELVRFKPDWINPNVVEQLESSEEAEKIALAIDSLHSSQKEIVLLRIWSRLSFDEIAQLTEKSRTTVFRQYTNALEKLKEKLEGADFGL
ncbi:MAG: RNA polymerase sigma factor [Thermoguttaceae bacterium]